MMELSEIRNNLAKATDKIAGFGRSLWLRDNGTRYCRTW